MISHGNKPLSPEEVLLRLQEHVRPDGDCLIWAGRTTNGRPRIMWRRRLYPARRLMMSLMGRLNLASDQVVYDICRTPLCMNPDHLKVTSRSQATKDQAKAGRMLSGPARSVLLMSTSAKLPYTERHSVLNMRRDGMTWNQIGATYGITGKGAIQAYQRWQRIGLVP